jgi:radical SAM/Cys-rich protein
MQTSHTLNSRRHDLASPELQLKELSAATEARFDSLLADAGLAPLLSEQIQILQMNVGKVCNQSCHHCHVDAGPGRRESMRPEVVQACLDVVHKFRVPVLDITGGAPELHPAFRRIVREARSLDTHVIDRCNLTVLLAPRFQDLPEFLAENNVEVVASLPCYLAENTDRQRGDGVFAMSIEALKRLNAQGYGQLGSGLELTLVHNPVGPHLPPSQSGLETAYRRELGERFGIEFTRLFTITNMPISRFLEELLVTGDLNTYLDTLVRAFNPATVTGLMCRTTLSVGWDGRLFDCDFNQMLELGLGPGLPRTIHDFSRELLSQRRVTTAIHCFGCTAGFGSGCQGATASS